jgi:hypothetical protein
MSQARKKTHARGGGHEHPGQPGMPLAPLGYQPWLTLLIELTELWYGAAKKLTTYAIDATEGMAHGVVDGQRLLSGWAKDTPVAPLLEEQQEITREFVARSAQLARRLWLLQLEHGEAAVERAEEEMRHLAQAPAS